MPRKVNVRWDQKANAWRADVGFRGENGRRKSKYFREIPNTAKGERLAEEACENWVRERDRTEQQVRIEASDPTLFDGLVQPFLANLVARVGREDMETRTVRSYEDRLNRLCDFKPTMGPHAGIGLQDRRLSSITDDDGQAWINRMREEGLSATRISGVLSAAKTMFEWGVVGVVGREPKVILKANPFSGLRSPSVTKPRRNLPTPLEAARFFRAARRDVEAYTPECGRCAGCKKAHRRGKCRRSHNIRSIHYRALLVLLRLQVYAGTRPSELCRATWTATDRHPDIGWNPRAWRDPATGQALIDVRTGEPMRHPRTGEVIRDPETGHWWGMLVVWGKTTRATGRLRRIAVPPALTRAIERIREARLHDVYVFPRLTRGGSGCWPVEGVDRHVRRWRSAAGIGPHFAPYNFRHRMYTKAIHAGGLTTDQAGAVGGTAGPTVASTYLQASDPEVFQHAAIISRAGRKTKVG